MNSSLPEITTNHRVVAPLVADTIPPFLKESFPNFRDFIQAYIAWGEQDGQVGQTLGFLKLAKNLDQTPDQILFKIKSELAPHIEDQRFLAVGVNPDSSIPTYRISWSWMRHLGDYYRTKGTQESFIHLFRLLYGTEILVSFPKDRLVRTSHTNTIRPFVVVVEVPYDLVYPLEHLYENLFIETEYRQSPSSNIVSLGQGKTVKILSNGTALIPAVVQVEFDNPLVKNLQVTGTGQFRFTFDVDSELNTQNVSTLKQLDGVFFDAKVGISSVEVGDGEGWQPDEKILLVPSDSNSSGIQLRVKTTDDEGSIRDVEIQGIGFSSITGWNEIPITASGINHSVIVNYGYISRPSGVIISSNSIPSDRNSVLQNNVFYQLNSYVMSFSGESLPVNFNDTEFRKFAHPVGMRYFFIEEPNGQISDTSTQMSGYDIPSTGTTVDSPFFIPDVPYTY